MKQLLNSWSKYDMMYEYVCKEETILISKQLTYDKEESMMIQKRCSPSSVIFKFSSCLPASNYRARTSEANKKKVREKCFDNVKVRTEVPGT
jgi:hypothetical protein